MLVLSACGGDGAKGRRTGSACAEQIGTQRALLPPPPLTWPESTIFFTASLTSKQLGALIEKEVPVVLAAEKNKDIGAPGRATFTVRRGSPRISADEKSLAVSVPVSATIDVCKPLGSMCLGYGHCEPAFTAHFRASTRLGNDYELPKPTAELEVERRCVIAIDVTPEIVRQAERELDKVEQRLSRARPDLRPWIDWALEESTHPQPLGDGSCLRVHPEALLYQPPSSHDGGVEVGVGVRGTIEPEACDGPASVVPRLPVQTLPHTPGESALWLPELVPLDTLAAHLRAALTGRVDEDLEVTEVQTTLAREGVALDLTLSGDVCGTLRLVGTPRGNEAEQAVEFVFELWGEGLDSRVHERLGKYVAAGARWPLRQLFLRRIHHEKETLGRVRKELARFDTVRLALEHAPGSPRGLRVWTTSRGLAVGLPLPAGLVVSPR